MAFGGVCCIIYVGLYNYIAMIKRMKLRRNLTRYKYSRLMVRNNRIWQNWKRKLLKIWINEEFD